MHLTPSSVLSNFITYSAALVQLSLQLKGWLHYVSNTSPILVPQLSVASSSSSVLWSPSPSIFSLPISLFMAMSSSKNLF